MRVGQPNPRNWRNVPRKPRYIWLLATRQLARKRQRSLMSLLITSPATVAAAATHLAGIGSALSTANAAAAAPTTALSVAGADEVSVLIAALFEAYAQEYQALSAQALAFHDCRPYRRCLSDCSARAGPAGPAHEPAIAAATTEPAVGAAGT